MPRRGSDTYTMTPRPSTELEEGSTRAWTRASRIKKTLLRLEREPLRMFMVASFGIDIPSTKGVPAEALQAWKNIEKNPKVVPEAVLKMNNMNRSRTWGTITVGAVRFQYSLRLNNILWELGCVGGRTGGFVALYAAGRLVNNIGLRFVRTVMRNEPRPSRDEPPEEEPEEVTYLSASDVLREDPGYPTVSWSDVALSSWFSGNDSTTLDDSRWMTASDVAHLDMDRFEVLDHDHSDGTYLVRPI